ncbi:MAG: hydrogenase maturation protease [Deltaproteobacteria bacterium]|nr:hydrogenase maturation protease [Deltaproteobacteria bacterium]
MKKQKTAIIGIGNKLMGDEGIGVHAIEHLRNSPSPPPLSHQGRGNNVKVDLVDGGTGGIALLHILEKYEHAIIIDAADFGGEKGEICHFDIDSKQIILKPDSDQISLHSMSLAGIIKLANQLDIKLPKITIIAVQPEKIAPQMELSSSCKSSIMGIEKMIKEII